MEINVQIKNRFTGSIIFEYKTENNTIKKTVEEYIKQELKLGKRYANLSYANLSYADLSSADLRYANLSYANLSSADLRSADLRYADLSSADLRSADLSYANLSSADLRSADLSYANLISSNLSSADLSYAYLISANLSSANLSSANLSYADLSYAKNKYTAYIPVFCKWSFSIKGDLIQIGCKEKTIKDWDDFFDSNDVYETQRNTEEFKQIEAVYLACKAYLLHLKN